MSFQFIVHRSSFILHRSSFSVFPKMAKKAFLLRVDDAVLASVQRWADEELRSLNGQIEYLLRQALARRGVKTPEPPAATEGNTTDSE
jgi:hypothetical protein